MLRTIVAVERDGLDVRTISITVDVPDNNFDIRQAVINACTDYVKTEEGREVYEGNCGNFNWADFEAQLPDEFCEKHGFKKVHFEFGDLEVNWDEHLVDDGALESEDDE